MASYSAVLAPISASGVLRKMTFAASFAPITAISADGQDKFTSPFRCFELITSYAPPYAFRVMTVSLGTVASANA